MTSHSFDSSSLFLQNARTSNDDILKTASIGIEWQFSPWCWFELLAWFTLHYKTVSLRSYSLFFFSTLYCDIHNYDKRTKPSILYIKSILTLRRSTPSLYASYMWITRQVMPVRLWLWPVRCSKPNHYSPWDHVAQIALPCLQLAPGDWRVSCGQGLLVDISRVNRWTRRTYGFNCV